MCVGFYLHLYQLFYRRMWFFPTKIHKQMVKCFLSYDFTKGCLWKQIQYFSVLLSNSSLASSKYRLMALVFNRGTCVTSMVIHNTIKCTYNNSIKNTHLNKLRQVNGFYLVERNMRRQLWEAEKLCIHTFWKIYLSHFSKIA